MTQQGRCAVPRTKGSFDAALQITPAWLTTLDVLTVGTWVDGNLATSRYRAP